MLPKKPDDEYDLTIANEIKDIPQQLWPIFCPTDAASFKQYKENIKAWRARSPNRRRAYKIWWKYQNHLPSKARKESLRYISTIAKIIDLKLNKKYKRNGGD